MYTENSRDMWYFKDVRQEIGARHMWASFNYGQIKVQHRNLLQKVTIVVHISARTRFKELHINHDEDLAFS